MVGDFHLRLPGHSLALRKFRLGTQAKDMEAGSEAEGTEGAAQPAFF